ncbi:MAG: translation initiation factor IF-6 [Candidatus Thermoplasmatota archaeon]|nr:translation initiation factor IF-6 [Candidatus Thermoplasmatota archaeon]
MSIRIADINGNPFIGVFIRQVGRFALCPMDIQDEVLVLMKEVMGVEAVRTAAGNTNLHGSLIAANSHGMTVPYFYEREDVISALSTMEDDMEGFEVVVCDDPHTAWGNNLLLSEKVALVNPDLSQGTLKLIEEVFQVEAVKGTIAGIKTVGSIAVTNSKGMIVHPKATDRDLEELKDLFGVEPYICTANFGSPHLGASMIVNDKGALVGSKSSGVELNRIENSLDLID